MPKNAMRIKDNSTCWVAGWGKAEKDRGSVTELQKVDVRYMNLDSCKREWQQHTKKSLPDTAMCAGGFTKDGKGFCQVRTCVRKWTAVTLNPSQSWMNLHILFLLLLHHLLLQGDSGGPLMCNGMAVGIVSFNFRGRCDYPNLPNVYTDLSKQLAWIKKASKNKKCYNWKPCLYRLKAL